MNNKVEEMHSKYHKLILSICFERNKEFNSRSKFNENKIYPITDNPCFSNQSRC